MVKSGKRGRPSIPLAVQNELWARAAGRCEFRGCNELVYLDPEAVQPVRDFPHCRVQSRRSSGRPHPLQEAGEGYREPNIDMP
jgi:hypothetical protein